MVSIYMLLNGEYLYKCDKGGYVIEVVKKGGGQIFHF